jgi:hypothetical protein
MHSEAGGGLPRTLHAWKAILIEGTSTLTVLISCVALIVVEFYGFREIIRLLRNR